jgi:hypothetical protein
MMAYVLRLYQNLNIKSSVMTEISGWIGPPSFMKVVFGYLAHCPMI